MPASKKSRRVLLKVRIPKALMGRIKKYMHRHELDNRTDAVIELLEKALKQRKRRPVRRQKQGGVA